MHFFQLNSSIHLCVCLIGWLFFLLQCNLSLDRKWYINIFSMRLLCIPSFNYCTMWFSVFQHQLLTEHGHLFLSPYLKPLDWIPIISSDKHLNFNLCLKKSSFHVKNSFSGLSMVPSPSGEAFSVIRKVMLIFSDLQHLSFLLGIASH